MKMDDYLNEKANIYDKNNQTSSGVDIDERELNEDENQNEEPKEEEENRNLEPYIVTDFNDASISNTESDNDPYLQKQLENNLKF